MCLKLGDLFIAIIMPRVRPHFLTFLLPLLCVVTLASLPAFAGRYPATGTQNFTYATGTKNLGDGTVIGSTDTGTITSIQNSALQLVNRNFPNTNASYKLYDLDPGFSLASWDVSCKMMMRAPNSGTPADGWALNVGPIPDGNGNGEGGYAMSGGLFISFTTYVSPRIQVFANGISIFNQSMAFTFDTTFRTVVVHWDANGLDLTYAGNSIFSNLATTGYVPAPGHRFAFTARTGGSRQTTSLDDLLITTVPAALLETGGPVISEFCADNEGTLDDENGDSSDWIEIYNGSNAAVNLSGWFLSNNALVPDLWALPNVSIPAYGYITVYASAKNRSDPANPLHTNFSLSKTSGTLALVKPDTSVASTFTYSAQVGDVSYGLLANAGGGYTYGYLETPTPGSGNLGLQAAGPPAEDVVYLKGGLPTTGGLFVDPFTLEIQTPAAVGAVVRYTLDNTPPTETSPIYSTPISISATTTVRARVYAPDRLPGELASRTFLKLDASLSNYHSSGQPFSSNLPIIVLDSFNVPVDSYTTEGSRPHRLSQAIVIDRNPAAPSPDSNRAVITGVADFQGRCGVHVRGETSAGFDQKSYAWELWNNENEDKDASILGMAADSDWVLHAPYTDKTLMRNYLTYDLMRQLNGTGAAMGVKFVEVFFNQDGGTVSESDYRGVYVLVEKIKRGGDRVNIEKMPALSTDPAIISGGYLFRKDKPDPGVVTFDTSGGQQFQFVEPEVPNTAQKNWLNAYVNQFEAALNGSNFGDPISGYAAYINPRSFIDNQWFVEITKQIDGYRLSTYFTKDRNGKISCAPVWDYNLSMFNADYNTGDVHSGWYHSQLGTADYYYWPRLQQDPNYKIQHWDRYWDLRRGAFAAPTIVSYIDGIAAELTQGSATPVVNSMANQAPLLESPAMRHYRKWPILGTYVWPNGPNSNGRTKYWTGPTASPANYTTTDGEVDSMKSFLLQRLNWIDDQNTAGTVIYRPPVFSLSGGSIASGTALEISRYTGTAPSGFTYASGGTLYYTTNETDPRDANGIASGTAYTGPIVLTNSATIKARLFANGTWSPLTTASFIVNAVAADATNMVISEICYRPTPPAPGSAEFLAGYTSGNNFEYLELLNVSQGNVDLSGCEITGGITFSFVGVSPAKLTVAPGERVLIVGNEAAFAMRYGVTQANKILGVYAGNLSNSGEQVNLLAASTVVIASVTYGVITPWPETPNTGGFSLVLDRASTTQNYNATDFRASLQTGGTPGLGAGFTAEISLTEVSHTYDGNPHAVVATTNPLGFPVSITYAGNAAAPVEPGSYAVAASVNHFDYTGSASATLVITPPVVVPPVYANWIEEEFTPVQISNGDAAMSADPDGDGHTNLMEYALGSNPRQHTGAVSGGVMTDPLGAKRLTLSFIRPTGRPDLVYTVEVSDNLAAGWAAVPSLEVSPIVGTNTESVIGRSPTIIGAETRSFIRLRVTHVPPN